MDKIKKKLGGNWIKIKEETPKKKISYLDCLTPAQ